MFFRQKKSADRVCLQIVENERVDGRVRQRVIATVGRMDELAATCALDTLLASGARFSEHAMLLSALAADAEGPRLHCRRISCICPGGTRAHAFMLSVHSQAT